VNGKLGGGFVRICTEIVRRAAVSWGYGRQSVAKLILLLPAVLISQLAFAQQTISSDDAARHLGENKTVRGTVVATVNTGKVCHLNFSHQWRTGFKALIFSENFHKFPRKPETYYKGKRLEVTGVIRDYSGRPSITLESPDQIRIVTAVRRSPSPATESRTTDRPAQPAQKRIERISPEGDLVTLNDRTEWQIFVLDRQETANWLRNAAVVVKKLEGSTGEHPYLIFNQDNSQQAFARQVR